MSVCVIVCVAVAVGRWCLDVCSTLLGASSRGWFCEYHPLPSINVERNDLQAGSPNQGFLAEKEPTLSESHGRQFA